MGKNQRIWCETIDGEAYDVFKSGERRVRIETSLAATPPGVEGEGFLLTYSGQSAINCLYRVRFQWQFCI